MQSIEIDIEVDKKINQSINSEDIPQTEPLEAYPLDNTKLQKTSDRIIKASHKIRESGIIVNPDTDKIAFTDIDRCFICKKTQNEHVQSFECQICYEQKLPKDKVVLNCAKSCTCCKSCI